MRSFWLLLGLAGSLFAAQPSHGQTQGPQDPCFSTKKTNVAFSSTSGTLLLVAGLPLQRIFVCGFTIIVPSAVSISLSEGASATCGTSGQAAVMGVSTSGSAANGMAFPANGGMSQASNSSIAQTATAGNSLCLFQSGSAQVAGNLLYVQTQQ